MKIKNKTIWLSSLINTIIIIKFVNNNEEKIGWMVKNKYSNKERELLPLNGQDKIISFKKSHIVYFKYANNGLIFRTKHIDWEK